jgi:hypothetical protein
MHQALSTNPSTTKKKRKGGRERGRKEGKKGGRERGSLERSEGGRKEGRKGGGREEEGVRIKKLMYLLLLSLGFSSQHWKKKK